MGSGKSVVGALVAYRARAPFLDLDFMIENEAAMRIHEIFARRGEAAFRSLESRLLPDALQSGGGAALGGGTVIDHANWRPVPERWMPVYLELVLDTLRGRLGLSEDRALCAGRVRRDVGGWVG